MFRTGVFLAVAALISIASGCGGKAETVKREVTFVTELTREDLQESIKQKFCPVTDERIGSMGRPIKAVADGRHFYLCCPTCEDDAQERFDELFDKVQSQTPGT
jgi:hypothetical protein